MNYFDSNNKLIGYDANNKPLYIHYSNDINGKIFYGPSSNEYVNYLKEESSNYKQNKMSEKNKIPMILNKKINNIGDILNLIYNTFQSRFNSLHCFFTIGFNDKKTCFHYINSFPIIKFSILKDDSYSIVFSSDWNGTPKIYDGWDSIPSREEIIAQNKACSYGAKSVFIIKNAQKINLYKWGFEIINDEEIQFSAILGYALIEKPENIIGKSSYTNPFNKEIINSLDFMEIVASWIRIKT